MNNFGGRSESLKSLAGGGLLFQTVETQGSAELGASISANELAAATIISRMIRMTRNGHDK